jgi:hypothetical protein
MNAETDGDKSKMRPLEVAKIPNKIRNVNKTSPPGDGSPIINIIASAPGVAMTISTPVIYLAQLRPI